MDSGSTTETRPTASFEENFLGIMADKEKRKAENDEVDRTYNMMTKAKKLEKMGYSEDDIIKMFPKLQPILLKQRQKKMFESIDTSESDESDSLP